MVLQGEKHGSVSCSSVQCGMRDPAARKASFEAVQRQELERKKAKEEESKKYGVWGSVYKNKQNFVDMHHY